MTDLALQNQALNNKVRRLEYRLHIYRGINEDLLKQNAQLKAPKLLIRSQRRD